jgi:hypothetical protein
MDAMMTCPSCHAPLRVPRSAAGHQARCSECGHIFTIPQAEDLFEETCSTWIEEDFEHADPADDQPAAPSPPATEPTRSPSASPHHGTAPPTLQPPGPHPRDKQTQPQPEAQAATSQPPTTGPADATAPEPATTNQPPEPAPAPSPPTNADEAGPASGPGDLDANRVARTANPAARAAGDDRYPTQLHITEPVPHMVVLSVDSAGVRFGFDSIWLDHLGFRGSMPVRCVFCGETDRESLIARPLIFVDQARTNQHRELTQQLNEAHEHRIVADRPPTELARQMGTLQKLPYPFDRPMPYYVSTRYAHMALHCETRDRADGEITCEVVIPDARAARQWLANVNGVCGPEYAMLAEDTSLLHGELWKQLPIRTRERIGAWCKLRPREAVRLYLNDADLGHHDEGLGGLLITDQRLVFCKHHRRGQVERGQHPATIHAKVEGPFAELKLEMAGQRTRMIKIRHSELPNLEAELTENNPDGQLQIAKH